MRVGSILRRNGWKKAPLQKRIDGKPQWYWEKVVTGGDEVVTEVVTPLNPLSATISEQVSPPVTTFSSNFFQNTNDVVEAADETNNSKSGESLENRGSDTCSQTSESFSEQGLEGVTTSASPPQFTYNLIAPPEPETAPTAPTAQPLAPSDLKPKSEQAISDADAETIRKLSAQQPTSTLSTGSSQSNLLLLQDYARRIGEALGYQSPATAKAIAEYIQESIVNQDITESSLAEVAGIENWQAFTALRNLTENEKNLVEIVQQAIASNDAETAKDVLISLKEVCDSGAASRQKVWNSGLTESEREAFSALIQ